MDPLQNQTTPPVPPVNTVTPPPPPPVPAPAAPIPPTPEAHTPVGPVVGSIIIIIVLVLGALYFWGQRADNAARETQSEQVMQSEESVESAPAEAAPSDEVSVIEDDLKMESFTDLEASISEIE